MSEENLQNKDETQVSEPIQEEVVEEKKPNAFNNFFSKIGLAVKHFFVPYDDHEPGIVLLYRKDATKSILSSLISIGIGMLIGLIIMILIALFGKNGEVIRAFRGLGYLFKGCFSSTRSTRVVVDTGNTIFYAVPLIFTGLSVGIAFKTGLFNIGAAGQFVMGTLGALLVGLYLQTTNRVAGVFVWILAALTGMICGMLWGVIPGLLKALFNINEVIICIMTNWIAANIATWVFENCPVIISKANTKQAFLIKPAEAGNFTPTLGLDKLFPGSYIDLGIVLAIIVAVIIYIILNKTTFGYELKACGANRNASRYAGLNEKRNIVLSMAIAGALAGLGASMYYLNAGIEYNYLSQYAALPAYGFDGIAAAFLANCNPIGIIFTSIFIKYINTGGEYLANRNVQFSRYVADIIIATIIYVAGFSRIIRELLAKKRNSKEKKIPDKIVLSNNGGNK